MPTRGAATIGAADDLERDPRARTGPASREAAGCSSGSGAAVHHTARMSRSGMAGRVHLTAEVGGRRHRPRYDRRRVHASQGPETYLTPARPSRRPCSLRGPSAPGRGSPPPRGEPSAGDDRGPAPHEAGGGFRGYAQGGWVIPLHGGCLGQDGGKGPSGAAPRVRGFLLGGTNPDVGGRRSTSSVTPVARFVRRGALLALRPPAG